MYAAAFVPGAYQSAVIFRTGSLLLKPNIDGSVFQATWHLGCLRFAPSSINDPGQVRRDSAGPSAITDNAMQADRPSVLFSTRPSVLFSSDLYFLWAQATRSYDEAVLKSVQESHERAMAALATAQNLEVSWALSAVLLQLWNIFFHSISIAKIPQESESNDRFFFQSVKDDEVKAAWNKYKELIEIAMREKAQAQVFYCCSMSPSLPARKNAMMLRQWASSIHGNSPNRKLYKSCPNSPASLVFESESGKWGSRVLNNENCGFWYIS